MLIYFPQFRTHVTLFESVIRFVAAKLWNFLEGRLPYDKCIENQLLKADHIKHISSKYNNVQRTEITSKISIKYRVFNPRYDTARGRERT